MHHKAYMNLLIAEEQNPVIKEQLKAIVGEDSAGERPTDGTPREVKDLFGDGYLFIKEIIDMIDSGEDMSTLDICCGKGEGLDVLGPRSLGVDIHVGEDSHSRVIKDDLTNPEQSIYPDIVTWFQGIEHFSAEDSDNIINNVLDVYMPDTVIISTINKDCDPWVSGWFILTGHYNPYHVNEFDAFEFQELSQYFTDTMFYSQYWVPNKGSVFVPGLYEDAINFYMVAKTA